MFLDLPPVILLQVKATIDKYGQCWLHGDGNFYDKKEDSDFRKDFSNPRTDNGEPAASYRIHFTSVHQVPADTDGLKKMFLATKSQELSEKGNPPEVVQPKSISIEKYLEQGVVKEDVKDKEIAELKAQLAKLHKPLKTQAEIDEEELQFEIAEEAAKTKKK